MDKQCIPLQRALREVLATPGTCAVNGIYWIDHNLDDTYKVGIIGYRRGKTYSTWRDLTDWAVCSRLSIDTGWDEAPYHPTGRQRKRKERKSR